MPYREPDQLPLLPSGPLSPEVRAEVRERLSRLLKSPPPKRRAELLAIAQQTGVVITTVLRWLRHVKNTGDLPPAKRGLKPGQRLLDPAVDALIEQCIAAEYRKPWKATKRDRGTRRIWELLRDRCQTLGLVPPHLNTVRNRIRAAVAKSGHTQVACTQYGTQLNVHAPMVCPCCAVAWSEYVDTPQ